VSEMAGMESFSSHEMGLTDGAAKGLLTAERRRAEGLQTPMKLVSLMEGLKGFRPL